MISDGWNCSGPAPSQRRAPLIFRPKPGISTSSSSTNANEHEPRRVAAHVLEPVAREQVHRDQADRAVGEVLDEVRRAVALALEQRPRRGGRVDHDRAAREQAEGGGEQQSVLERLLSPAWHQACFRRPAPDASRRRERIYVELDQGPGERPEVVAALLVAAVLVVRRAGGREQHDVAGRRGGARGRDGALEVAAVVQRRRPPGRAPRAARRRSRRSGTRRGSARPRRARAR